MQDSAVWLFYNISFKIRGSRFGFFLRSHTVILFLGLSKANQSHNETYRFACVWLKPEDM